MSDEETAIDLSLSHTLGMRRPEVEARILAALRAARREERERCARVADGYPAGGASYAIRALGDGEEIK